jgi:hypothetical protein
LCDFGVPADVLALPDTGTALSSSRATFASGTPCTLVPVQFREQKSLDGLQLTQVFSPHHGCRESF